MAIICRKLRKFLGLLLWMGETRNSTWNDRSNQCGFGLLPICKYLRWSKIFVSWWIGLSRELNALSREDQGICKKFQDNGAHISARAFITWNPGQLSLFNFTIWWNSERAVGLDLCYTSCCEKYFVNLYIYLSSFNLSCQWYRRYAAWWSFLLMVNLSIWPRRY